MALVIMTTATAAAGPNGNTAGPPTSNGVQPTYQAGNITRCPDGTTTFINTSDGGRGDRSASYSNDGTTFATMISRDGVYLSFTTNSPSFTVYVKGGPAFNIYDYTGTPGNPAYPSDTRLHAPFNRGGRLPEIGHYVVCGQPANIKATPKLTTNPSAGGTVNLVVLNDTAILSEGASPRGSITFNLFDPSESDCSGPPFYTQTVPVSGDGSYTTGNTAPAPASGTWSWTAVYSGDDNNNSVSSGCAQETVSVNKAVPTLTTTPSAGGTVGAVTLNDTGTLADGMSPGGSMTFNLYDPSHSDCSGAPAFTQTVPVSGNGDYKTTGGPEADTAGTWSWTASYTGDALNNAASSDCHVETVAVATATTSVATTAGAGGAVGVALTDTATVSGGFNPGGTITFNLYDPSHSDCSDTPFFTTTVPVSGNGDYKTTSQPPTNAVGTWTWTASYSGDTNNSGDATACGEETVSVVRATTSLTTKPGAGGAAGTVKLDDMATLSGGFNPGGSITFSLFDPSHTDCSGSPAFTQTVPVSGNGTYGTTNNTAVSSVPGTWTWTANYSGDTNNAGTSSGCGQETVTVTPAGVAQGSCEGSASLSTLVSGTNVISYVPKGSWTASPTATGIDVVNVEGSSITNTLIPTGTDVINSCASNSLTGQTVCTANNNHVYVLKGTGLDPAVSNPLTDAGTGSIAFSAGMVTTAGVTMDATHNQALIGLSLAGTAGYQFLGLGANPTFEQAFTTQDAMGVISEAPLIDPIHQVVLSAAEDNNVEAVNVATSTSPRFFEHPLPRVGGVLDSTSEDCSTGIVFAPKEFSGPSQVEIADISNPGTPPNAVFTPGTPGSWTAPEQIQTLAGSNLSSGATGSAVAQGTHTGVISGEFGGDRLTALALPATSGSGAVPAISKWLSCGIGSDPLGVAFDMGDDPHTLTAYQSPNAVDAMALVVNEGATEMVQIDLTKMLNLSATTTPDVCDSGTMDSNTVRFIPMP
jgi:hypothetical protein